MDKLNFTLHDQHVHTSFSADSKEDVEEYIKIATNKGCNFFVTTDHLDLDIAGTGRDWHADYKQEFELFDSLKDKYNIQFLKGIEYGYKVSERKRIEEVLKEVPFDIINASVHDYENIDFYFYKDFEKYGIEKTITKYFELLIEVANSDWDYDVLSHIDYGFKTLYLQDNNYSIKNYEKELILIFKGIIKNSKALEINTKVQEAINDDEHLKYILNLYKSLGGNLLTLSSDAHEKKRYLSGYDKYVRIIKDSGFDRLCYFVKRKMYFYDI